MGDIITILEIEFLKDTNLFQIDIMNETKREEYRLFVNRDTLQSMLDSAIAKGDIVNGSER